MEGFKSGKSDCATEYMRVTGYRLTPERLGGKSLTPSISINERKASTMIPATPLR